MVLRARAAVTKTVITAIVVVAIVAGGAAVYYYTLPQALSIGGTSTSSATTANASVLGYQDKSGQPMGTWAAYLGYIPAGYVTAPHSFNAPNFPCPPGMSPSQCSSFEQTCGNGVCDPNETCQTCPIDCAPSGNLVCDPYTGRPGMPASVCQAIVQNNQAGFGG